MNFDKEVYVTSAWALDFVRALNERPKIFKWLFKIAIGRYAWREFVGMYQSIPYADFEYELKSNDYHKERPELWGMK